MKAPSKGRESIETALGALRQASIDLGAEDTWSRAILDHALSLTRTVAARLDHRHALKMQASIERIERSYNA